MEWYWWVLIALLGTLTAGTFYAIFEEWLEKNDWI